jgi:hypothetical protein
MTGGTPFWRGRYVSLDTPTTLPHLFPCSRQGNILFPHLRTRNV